MQITDVNEILFEYIRDLIYHPDRAKLDIASLPADYQQLGKALVFLGASIDEIRDFSNALAKGILTIDVPSRDNELAAPLKALHASLRHITWQSQQVARGDYGQKIEFMGEFAAAFNLMIRQLDQRQKALEAEIEKSVTKTVALEQSNRLFRTLTAQIDEGIIVMDAVKREVLYVNPAGQLLLTEDSAFRQALLDCLTTSAPASAAAPAAQTTAASMAAQTTTAADNEFQLETAAGTRYFTSNTYPLSWNDRKAVAYIISDITAKQAQMKQLADYAFVDPLTKVNSRYAGMRLLQDWLDARADFCLTFVDLDNLKYVNDTYGHSEGDEYIVTTAIILQELSAESVVSRLGGDEFMILTRHETAAATAAELEILRSRLVNCPAGTRKPYLQSISYGIVAVDPANPYSAKELLSQADEKMYAYKKAHKRGPTTDRGGPA